MSELSEGMILVHVRLICAALTDSELAGLNLCLATDQDPRKLPQYDKVSMLFTDSDLMGWPIMHDSVKAALQIVVEERLY